MTIWVNRRSREPAVPTPPPSRYHVRYPAYRDSGVKCVGEIPAHWEMRRLKECANAWLSNVDKKSVEGEPVVRLCNYVDVYHHDRIHTEIDFMTATATPAQIRKFSLREGDVLITKDSESWTDIAVPALVTEDLADVVCGYHLALIRPRPDCVGGFIGRAIGAVGPREQYRVAANGITRFGLTADAIRNGILPWPPPSEQHSIVYFLDRETARVDALIAKQQELIGLLQEKRTALINRTVTKGLDPDAAMKDTGVDWLGEIPAQWEVGRLKQTVSECQNGIWGEDPDGTNDIACVRVADFDRGTFGVDLSALTLRNVDPQARSTHGLRMGDLLLEKSGGGEKQPVGAVVIFAGDMPAVCSNFIARMPVSDDHDPLFLVYLHAALYSIRINGRSIKQSIGIQNLDSASYLNELVGLPPLNEQNEIARHLDRETATIDRLVAKANDAIVRLNEYRTALISAAVTGKIDVRHHLQATTTPHPTP